MTRQSSRAAWEQTGAHWVTLPTKVETPPRAHSSEDVQPSPLPHNSVYAASAGRGQRRAITRQQAGGNPQHSTDSVTAATLGVRAHDR